MKLLSFFTLLAASAVLTPPAAFAWSLNFQQYAGSVLSEAFYGGSHGFSVWAQGAEESLIPLFKEIKGKEVTLVMPSAEAFNTVLEAHGGNWSDPRTGMTPALKAVWNDALPYFFFRDRLNVTEIPDGTTVLLESYKRSPAGDWPLAMAYRRDPGIAEAYLADANSTWNGTIYFEPSGETNVTIAAFDINEDVVGMVTEGWPASPTEPQNLTQTIAALGVSGWDALTQRLPAAAALDTQRNFTLFLPPSAVISTALSTATTVDDLAAFLSAHIVPSRIALSLAAQVFTTQSGGALSVAAGWAAVDGVNATVVRRDVLTNGGIVQVVDRSLLN